MSRVRYMYLHAKDGEFVFRNQDDNKDYMTQNIVTVAMHYKGHKVFVVRSSNEPHCRKKAREYAFDRLANVALEGKSRKTLYGPTDNKDHTPLKAFAIKSGFKSVTVFKAALLVFLNEQEQKDE
jgi:hypothetical protein